MQVKTDEKYCMIRSCAVNNATYEEQRKRAKRQVTQTAGAKVLGVRFISVHR
jgi:hypothetical protein